LAGDLMASKHYVIIKCPVCQNYTYTLKSIKHKLCPYCGKIIPTRKYILREVLDVKEAHLLVKELNLKKAKANKDEFMFQSLKAKVSASLNDKRLLRKLLSHYASKEPILLDEFIDIAKDTGLDESYVLSIIEEFTREGIIFFPTEAKLQYIDNEKKSQIITTKQISLQKISQLIVDILIKNPDGLLFEDIALKLAEIYPDIDTKQIENAINKLLELGRIYSPKPHVYRIVS